ncbi:plastid developmental protein DAG [Striga asiatica]|uniref:Plastid developmental protein DAG n=1 Tax=Striga asiatica TaxID=4170 RepID=A0A5A7P3R9_STRAF|nr:plastid developmental protein DAG [Striga asiatica]
MATLNLSILPKTLTPNSKTLTPLLSFSSSSSLSFVHRAPAHPAKTRLANFREVKVVADGEYSAKRGGGGEERETIMLPGCDYNHWLIVMEFPKDPAPTREQMIDTYLNTLATVLGSLPGRWEIEEHKSTKLPPLRSVILYELMGAPPSTWALGGPVWRHNTSLPGVLWVLPDSYLDVKNKDYGVFMMTVMYYEELLSGLAASSHYSMNYDLCMPDLRPIQLVTNLEACPAMV